MKKIILLISILLTTITNVNNTIVNVEECCKANTCLHIIIQDYKDGIVKCSEVKNHRNNIFDKQYSNNQVISFIILFLIFCVVLYYAYNGKL